MRFPLQIRTGQASNFESAALGLRRPYDHQSPCEPVPVPEFPGFQTSVLGPHSRWKGLSLSLALHLCAIPLLPALVRLIPERAERVPNLRVASREPIEFFVPRALYAPASPRAGRKSKSAGGAAVSGRRTGPAGSGPRSTEAGQAGDGASGGRRPVRAFELPPVRNAVPSEQTLLQPPPAPETKPLEPQKLPQVAFWSANPPRAPRPPARRFVVPGRPEVRAAPPELTAPPVLETPNPERLVSDLKIAASEPIKEAPALPRPPATTMPIRTFAPAAPAESVTPSLDATVGDASNLVALSPNPAPPRESFVVKPGLQMGNLPTDQEGLEGGRGGGAGSGRGAGTGGNTGAESNRGSGGSGVSTGSGSGGGTNPGGRGGEAAGAAGSGTGVAGTGSGRGGSGSGPGPGGSGGGPNARGGAGGSDVAGNRGAGPPGGSGLGSSGSAPGGGLAPANNAGAGLAASVPIRMIHPLSGVFDVVAVHSSSSDALPEARRLLSGTPIYSVYLKVGSAKEWMLQYCEVKSATRATGRVIQLGTPSRLMSPYPKLTVMPPPALVSRARRTILVGFLNHAGQFRDLKPTSAEDQEFYSKIAPFLSQWEFRPATRDGKPVEVELLLVIPDLGCCN